MSQIDPIRLGHGMRERLCTASMVTGHRANAYKQGMDPTVRFLLAHSESDTPNGVRMRQRSHLVLSVLKNFCNGFPLHQAIQDEVGAY